MTAPVPPLVTWSLVTVGAFLVYASVRGLSPLGELTATLQGKATPGPTTLGVGPGTGTLLVSPDPGDSAAPGDKVPSNWMGTPIVPGAPAGLVSIGQGSFKLAGPTAQAFQAWQGAFGRTIYLTDAYRDYVTQLHGWQRDPSRFAPPDKSFHVKGQAVDVDLGRTGADADRQNTTWNALYAAATATGWCNPRGPYKGDHKEPWHFSYPGCG